MRFNGTGLCVGGELLGGFRRNGGSCYFGGWWVGGSVVKLCELSTNGGCNFGNFLSECRFVSIFSLWVFKALGMVQGAGEGGVRWTRTGFGEVGRSRGMWSMLICFIRPTLENHYGPGGASQVCVLHCFINPILGNRYGPGVSCCQQTSDNNLGWPDSHPPH